MCRNSFETYFPPPKKNVLPAILLLNFKESVALLEKVEKSIIEPLLPFGLSIGINHFFKSQK